MFGIVSIVRYLAVMSELIKKDIYLFIEVIYKGTFGFGICTSCQNPV